MGARGLPRDATDRTGKSHFGTGLIKALIEIVTGFASITGFLFSAGRFLLLGSLFLGSLTLALGASSRAGHLPGNQKAAGSDWQIECVAPGEAKAINLSMDDAKIYFALRRGVTSFIIRLAAPGQRPLFTLVNENRAARGKFSIAISQERLAPGNSKWKVVHGSVPFRHKRLFALSLVGVEAKYVKLTFQVDQPEKVRRRDEPARRATRFTVQR